MLEKYRRAYEQKDPELLATVYHTFPPPQQEASAKYFENKDLRVTISDVKITVQGNEAAVTYTRKDEFIDAKTKQKVKLDVRFANRGESRLGSRVLPAFTSAVAQAVAQQVPLASVAPALQGPLPPRD